jgi:hypothetical protein
MDKKKGKKERNLCRQKEAGAASLSSVARGQK